MDLYYFAASVNNNLFKVESSIWEQFNFVLPLFFISPYSVFRLEFLRICLSLRFARGPFLPCLVQSFNVLLPSWIFLKIKTLLTKSLLFLPVVNMMNSKVLDLSMWPDCSLHFQTHFFVHFMICSEAHMTEAAWSFLKVVRLPLSLSCCVCMLPSVLWHMALFIGMLTTWQLASLKPYGDHNHKKVSSQSSKLKNFTCIYSVKTICYL